METRDYNAVIIGFGKGGKTLAQELAKRGERVAVIEKSSSMYGGTCINVGCIPTKTLVSKAKLSGKHKCWDWEKKAEFYANAIEQKNGLIDALRNANFNLLANNENIDVIDGFGSFIDSNSVKVVKNDNTTITLKAEKIFINTGAKTIIPNIEGVELSGVYTSTTLLAEKTLPKSLCIVGGGYIGLEFASIYSNFGTEVTVLEFADSLIAREDDEIAKAVKERLEKMGVKFIFNASTQKIEAAEETKIVTFQDRKTGDLNIVKADAVLLAIGRVPNTDGLELENAGVELTPRGAISVDDYCQTTQPNIWAMGDVVGKEQFTYISLDDYRIVTDSLFGTKEKSHSSRTVVPYSVFIDPHLSRVGMSEKEAKQRGLNYTTATMPALAIPRAKLIGETDGVLKLIVNRDNGEILGCTIFAMDSHEMINVVAMAMRLKGKYTDLRDGIFTHPTMTESLNELAKMIQI